MIFFFQNELFQTILSGIPLCETVWIQILLDVLSSLSWVQTVCKGYQQTALVHEGKELKNIFAPSNVTTLKREMVID